MSLDELLDSADYALFHQISRNPLHVLNQLLPPRKRTVYNLRKLTHGLTIPLVSSSLMRKNFVIRMLYTDVYWYFYFHVFIHILFHVCLRVIVLSLRSDSDYNKEATYLLTYYRSLSQRSAAVVKMALYGFSICRRRWAWSRYLLPVTTLNMIIAKIV